MKFAIIGVGGVGGFFGGLLARAGNNVTFVARGEQFDALRKQGLTVNTVEGNFTIERVNVVDTVAQLRSPDVVLITTKTYDLDGVADQLAEVIEPETIVIPVQNGIDNDLRLKARLPDARVHPGLAYIISTRTAPGLVEQTAGPRTIFFGDRRKVPNAQLQKLEELMRKAGILATCSPDIELELWTKFLWITTFGGTTAVCRSAIGPIVNDPEAFEWYVRCLDEGIAVAQAHGVPIDDEARAKIIEKSEHYRHTGTHAKSSLLVDLEHKRPTEIESLNGALRRLARKVNVPTPINESIYYAVKLAEHYYSSVD